jgi:hypothetical protein
MALNFPSSPTNGQAFYPPNGPAWIYNSAVGAWKRNAGTALPTNKIVNPAMQISQQNGNTAGGSQDYYAADQFYITYGSATVVPSLQRVQSTTPKGSANRLRLTITTADPTLTSSEGLGLETRIESLRIADMCWGTAQAKQAILRFGWRSPAGTYSVSLWGSDDYIWFHFVISAGQANTDTEQILVVPPSGQAVTGFLLVRFNVAVGPFMQGGTSGVWSTTLNRHGDASNTNGIASTSNIFELFDVGFYVDPYKTGVAPDFVAPHYEDDLRECQRYWYRMFGSRGVVASGTMHYMVGNHPVPLRINSPALAIVGAPRLHEASVVGPVTSISHNYADTTTYYFGPAGAGPFVPGRPAQILCDAGTTTNYIAVNARL